MSDHPLQKLQIEIAQLKERLAIRVIRVSEACTTLQGYCLEEASNDPMLPQFPGENMWQVPTQTGCCRLH